MEEKFGQQCYALSSYKVMLAGSVAQKCSHNLSLISCSAYEEAELLLVVS